MPDQSPFHLGDVALAVGLALMSEAGQAADALDFQQIASLTGQTTGAVAAATQQLLDLDLVKAYGQFGTGPGVASKPLLARALEGRLGFSARQDDRRVLEALVGAGAGVQLTGTELSEQLGLDAARVNGAVARLQYDGSADVLREIAQSDFGFVSASATARARRA